MPRPDDSTLTPVQLARIRKEAERALQQAEAFGVLPTPIDEIMRVARVVEVEEDKKFNASNYAAIRQYVSKNHRTCAVVVLNMPELDPVSGFRATLRRVVGSERFQQMFLGIRWPELYTPNDDIGRLVPIHGRRASGKRQLGLADANGTLHDCVAESFSTGHQVFVLIHVVKALTTKQIILGSNVVDARCRAG